MLLGIVCWNCLDYRGRGIKYWRFFFHTENVPVAWHLIKMIISLLAVRVEHRLTLAYPKMVVSGVRFMR